VNPAFEQTTGYQRRDVLGGTPRILKSGQHEPEFYRAMWAGLLNRVPFRGTIVNRRKSGELYRAQQTITPIEDEAGNISHFVSVLRDVTELHRRHEQEVQLSLARKIQQRFYPSVFLSPDLEAAAVAKPADETGGDYCDFIPLADGSLAVAIGDVSGHGMDAALVMALVRAYVRAFASLCQDVGEVLSRVNTMLLPDMDGGRHATLLLAQVKKSRGLISYAGAGHLAGLVVSASGVLAAKMESTGIPLDWSRRWFLISQPTSYCTSPHRCSKSCKDLQGNRTL
jgi:PAS domain S-box-containing protein